jgi:hypothetical protein
MMCGASQCFECTKVGTCYCYETFEKATVAVVAAEESKMTEKEEEVLRMLKAERTAIADSLNMVSGARQSFYCIF